MFWVNRQRFYFKKGNSIIKLLGQNAYSSRNNARDAIDGVGKIGIETHNVSFDAAYPWWAMGQASLARILQLLSTSQKGVD